MKSIGVILEWIKMRRTKRVNRNKGGSDDLSSWNNGLRCPQNLSQLLSVYVTYFLRFVATTNLDLWLEFSPMRPEEIKGYSS